MFLGDRVGKRGRRVQARRFLADRLGGLMGAAEMAGQPQRVLGQGRRQVAEAFPVGDIAGDVVAAKRPDEVVEARQRRDVAREGHARVGVRVYDSLGIRAVRVDSGVHLPLGRRPQVAVELAAK